MIEVNESAMDQRVDGDARRRANERDKELQAKFYKKNGAACLALFTVWKTERDLLGDKADNSDAERALLDWVEGKVYKKVRREFFHLSERWDAVNDSLRLSWEDIAHHIMLKISDKLRSGAFVESQFLLGFIGNAHLIARGKLRDEVEYSSCDVPLMTGGSDEDEEIESEIELFDLHQLPIESLSVWTLCGDLIRWLSPADQEFHLVSRLVGLGDKETAMRLTGLSDEAFKGRNKRIVTRCKVVQEMLRAFRAPDEYFAHTKERVEGLVHSLAHMDRKRYPKTLDEANEMAKQASPVRLQDAVHSEDSQGIRKLLLRLYGRRNAV